MGRGCGPNRGGGEKARDLKRVRPSEDPLDVVHAKLSEGAAPFLLIYQALALAACSFSLSLPHITLD